MKPHEADKLKNRLQDLKDSKDRLNIILDQMIKETEEKLLEVLNG